MPSDPKKNSYQLKARPNLYDLAIMDGFLTGGGNAPAVQRMAYWAPAPDQSHESSGDEDVTPYPLHDDVDLDY